MAAQKLVRRGHQLELLQQAKSQCDLKQHVDLTIYCEDGVVRAHQMLLATASPFLKLLFQTSPLYGVEDISLVLPEVKACLVQALVHFVYTGTVVSKEDHFYSLMKLVYALNMNASIEAESTTEKPTTFATVEKRPPPPPMQPVAAPVAPAMAPPPPAPAPQPQQTLPPQYLSSQPLTLHTSSPSAISLPSQPVAMAQLPTQPLAQLPNQPPAAKMPRLATSTAALPSKIQLPTQPVPIAGVVNGQVKQEQPQQQQQTQSYIAMDPTTGLSYKVEMANGTAAAAAPAPDASSDPLAAIMNETIFTDTSGMYNTTGENGQQQQIIYQGPAQPPPPQPMTVTVSAAPTTVTTAIPIPIPVTVANPSSTPGGKGKKRKAGGGGHKENAVLTDTVEDLPCAPDDEDLNTPYPCDRCNKTIKGRVMLQAHHYQEHYENPDLASVAGELGEKHACRVCLKLFTRNSDVKAHILRVHCGDRRYPCTMCGKRFKESTHLRKHLYTHTGERPHYCSLCNKGFQTSSDLKRHKRTRVHQEKVEQAGGVEPTDTTNPNSNQGAPSNNTADTSIEEEEDEEMEEKWNPVGGNTSGAVAAAVGTTATVTTASTITASKSSPFATSSATPTTNTPSSTTIDMKAIGGGAGAWNNNSSNPNPTSGGTTVDLKDIKWQNANPAPDGANKNNIAPVPTADSPGQDEERLTVVESEDNNGQDGVVNNQQQQQPDGVAAS